jgi:hypothetical protein
MRITPNKIVAILGLMLGLAFFNILHKFGAPWRVCYGAFILFVLLVTIFWTTINLGNVDEDEDE